MWDDWKELRRVLLDALRDLPEAEARLVMAEDGPSRMRKRLGLVRVDLVIVPDDICNFDDEEPRP